MPPKRSSGYARRFRRRNRLRSPISPVSFSHDRTKRPGSAFLKNKSPDPSLKHFFVSRTPKVTSLWTLGDCEITTRPSFWRAYRLFVQDASHPSLRFKKLAGYENVWSVRINEQYRAVGERRGDTIMGMDRDTQRF